MRMQQKWMRIERKGYLPSSTGSSNLYRSLFYVLCIVIIVPCHLELYFVLCLLLCVRIIVLCIPQAVRTRLLSKFGGGLMSMF